MPESEIGHQKNGLGNFSNQDLRKSSYSSDHSSMDSKDINIKITYIK